MLTVLLTSPRPSANDVKKMHGRAQIRCNASALIPLPPYKNYLCRNDETVQAQRFVILSMPANENEHHDGAQRSVILINKYY